jgi:hypothetical protein
MRKELRNYKKDYSKDDERYKVKLGMSQASDQRGAGLPVSERQMTLRAKNGKWDTPSLVLPMTSMEKA